MSEAICCIARSAAWLVGLLGILLLHLLELAATWAVAVLSIACEVASWSLRIRVLVLLLLWLSLSSWLENWLWKGRWGSRELSCIGRGGEAVIALVIKVQEQPLAVWVIDTVLHGCGYD